MVKLPSLSANTLNFGSVLVDRSSSVRSVTLSNPGTTAVALSGVAVQGPYSYTTTCSASLGAGKPCRFDLVFAPTDEGPSVGSLDMMVGSTALTTSLTGFGQRAAVVSLSSSTLSFGQVAVGASSALSSRLTNMGNADLLLTEAPVLTGSDRFSATTNCGATLAPSAYCDTTVTFSPSVSSEVSGTLTYKTSVGNASVGMTGSGLQPWGTLTAATGSTTNFGNLALGTYSSNTFVFKNTGNALATGVYPVVTGDGLSISANACGTQAAPVTLATSQSCIVTVTYSPTVAASLAGSGALTVNSNAGNGPQTLNMTGTAGGFNASGSWSSTYTSVVAPTSANTVYTTQTAGDTSQTKYFYVINSGTTGSLGAAFKLSGDVQHFNINAAPVAIATGGGNVACGASVLTGSLETSMCKANDPAQGGAFRHIRIGVTYAPKTVGSHSITLTPSSTNGTALPSGLVLSGNADRAPVGTWSSTTSSTTALTDSSLAYPAQTAGVGSASKTVYLRSTGAYGALAASFALSGPDAQYFRISAVNAYAAGGGNLACGATISADGKSATLCTANDPALGSFSHIGVTVVYAPAVVGTHSVTLTPASTNGSTVPGPIVLTGSGAWSPAGTWSSVSSSTTALTAADTTYSAQTANSTTQTKSFYLRSTGTYGYLGAAFALQGDTTHFKISTAPVAVASGGGTVSCGSTLNAGSLSSTMCTTAAGSFSHIKVTVQYAPKSAGSHSVSLVSSSTNGSTVPAPITLSGSAN